MDAHTPQTSTPTPTPVSVAESTPMTDNPPVTSPSPPPVSTHAVSSPPPTTSPLATEEPLSKRQRLDVVSDTPSTSLYASIQQPLPSSHAISTFLDSLHEYETAIPDEVIRYLLEKTGCQCTDAKLLRMISLATQRFVFEIANDAQQYAKLKIKDKKEKVTELTMTDLSFALQSHGIDVIKPDYFCDTFVSGLGKDRSAATEKVGPGGEKEEEKKTNKNKK